MRRTTSTDTQGHVNEPENTAQEMIDDVNTDAFAGEQGDGEAGEAAAAADLDKPTTRPAPKRKFRIVVGPLDVTKHYTVKAVKELVTSNPGTYVELLLDGERFVFDPTEL